MPLAGCAASRRSNRSRCRPRSMPKASPRFLRTPAMNKALHYDVAIAGGGLVGASAALALAKSGLRVGLFERRFCGAQASGVNYGGVRCQGRPVEQMPLAMRARRVWDRLPELIGIDGEFVVSGHLRLARSEADLAALETWAQMARQHGLDPQLIGGNEFRRRYPWL